MITITLTEREYEHLIGAFRVGVEVGRYESGYEQFKDEIAALEIKLVEAKMNDKQ